MNHGISVAPTKEELEKQHQKDIATKLYKWKDLRGVEHEREFNLRESLDRQRIMERDMRTTRSKANTFKTGGQNEEYNVQKSRYRNQLAEYTRFSKAMGIIEQRERIYMDNLGRI